MLLSHRRFHFIAIPLLLCLAALAVSGCGLFVKRLPSGEAPRASAHDRFVTVDGVRLHYEDYPGAGVPIVLLHGFASSTDTWREIVDRLQSAGHRVVALDMKGFGWSEKPMGADYSPKTLMAEVNAWMAKLGLSRVVFVGNSLGGGIGLMLAIAHPERIDRLVLIDAAGYPIKKPLIIRAATVPGAGPIAGLFFSRWMVHHLLEGVYYDPKRVTEARVDAYFDRLRTEGALAAQVALSAALDDQAVADIVARIPQIAVPTLIIWGAEDPWIPLANAERFNREIAGSRLQVIAGCGHVPQEELPEVTATAITAFAAGARAGQ
ncbi:MAG: alpha/beta fold hydrolase [Pseudomonadota bacterium]